MYVVRKIHRYCYESMHRQIGPMKWGQGGQSWEIMFELRSEERVGVGDEWERSSLAGRAACDEPRLQESIEGCRNWKEASVAAGRREWGKRGLQDLGHNEDVRLYLKAVRSSWKSGRPGDAKVTACFVVLFFPLKVHLDCNVENGLGWAQTGSGDVS